MGDRFFVTYRFSLASPTIILYHDNQGHGTKIHTQQ